VASRARVFVGEFLDKTGVFAEFEKTGTTIVVAPPGSPTGAPGGKVTIRNPIGWGMDNQLASALTRTRCFRLYKTQTPPDGLGVDYVVCGAVTEYLPSEASMAAGLGYTPARDRHIPRRRTSDPTVEAGRLLLTIIRERAAAGMVGRDHVAIDVELINATTQEYESMTFEGKPTFGGVAVSGEFGRWVFDVGGQYRAPIQKVVRGCMDAAARWIASRTILMPRAARPITPGSEGPVVEEEKPLPPPEVPEGVPKVVVKVEEAIIRELPDADSRRLGCIQQGGLLDVVDSAAWAKVKLGPVEGWALAAALDAAGAVTAQTLSIRETPDEGSRERLTLRKGEQLEVVGDSRGWTRVRLGSMEGWVLTADVESSPSDEREGPANNR